MKKLFLALLVLAATVHTASAQVEIGVKVSPSVTFLRADAANGGLSNNGSKLSFGGGLLVDYFFGENYAFSTGLFLTGKGGTVKYSEPAIYPSTQKIAMQYLEVPASVKLFTNEVAPDVRMYFQLGVSAAVPIATRIDNGKYYTDPVLANKQTKASDHVLPVDANALLGFGAEYQLGKSTKVLAGLSYHRGLVNFDRYFEKERGYKNASIKNNVFALDLGMKF